MVGGQNNYIEITFVVFTLDINSAPSPNGFGRSLYHSCWDIVATGATTGTVNKTNYFNFQNRGVATIVYYGKIMENQKKKLIKQVCENQISDPGVGYVCER